MLNKLQKRVYMFIASTLSASLEPLIHHRNVVKFFFIDIALEDVNLSSFIFLIQGGVLVILIRCMILKVV